MMVLASQTGNPLHVHRKALPEQPDRPLVRCRLVDREVEEPQPAEAVSDQDLHPLVARDVRRGEHEHPEHHHGVEGRPSALRTVTVAQRLDEDGAERLEVDMADQRFQWMPVRDRRSSCSERLNRPGSYMVELSQICSKTFQPRPGWKCKRKME